MKKLLAILIFALATVMIQAEVSITVNLSAVNRLSYLLTSTEKTTVTNLTITGIMDARDMKCIRDELTKLTYLNISDVEIKAYTGTQGTSPISNVYLANQIPDWALSSKSSLKTLILPNSVTCIGMLAFSGCVNLSSLTMGNSVTAISGNAFERCSSMQTIIIPNSVISIGGYAFKSCTGLNSLNIPNSVINIGESAFESCTGLTSVIFGNSVATIGKYAFLYCSNLTSITIPNSVISIGEGSFGACTNLVYFTIGNHVTSIGVSAFYNCINLKNITIPNSVKSIGSSAFHNCKTLTSLSIPSSVTSIGEAAFTNCSGLTSIYAYPIDPINLKSTIDIFGNVNKRTTCSLFVPSGSISAYRNAFQWQDFTNIIEMTTGLFPISQSNIKIMTDNGKVIIENAKASDKVEIYGISGIKIKELSIESNQTIIQLPKGIYVIRIDNYSDKIIIK